MSRSVLEKHVCSSQQPATIIRHSDPASCAALAPDSVTSTKHKTAAKCWKNESVGEDAVTPESGLAKTPRVARDATLMCAHMRAYLR